MTWQLVVSPHNIKNGLEISSQHKKSHRCWSQRDFEFQLQHLFDVWLLEDYLTFLIFNFLFYKVALIMSMSLLRDLFAWRRSNIQHCVWVNISTFKLPVNPCTYLFIWWTHSKHLLGTTHCTRPPGHQVWVKSRISWMDIRLWPGGCMRIQEDIWGGYMNWSFWFILVQSREEERLAWAMGDWRRCSRFILKFFPCHLSFSHSFSFKVIWELIIFLTVD